MLTQRVLVLLLGCHIFVSTTAADKCRSCEYSREVPAAVWQEFSESLAALDRFTLADQALARRLKAVAGRQPDGSDNVIGNTRLQRFIYPWKPGGFDQDTPDSAADQTTKATNDTPPQPTWLHVPDPSDDRNDQRLSVSADEVRHEPALATQSRATGKWYWEVRYLPGSNTHPRAGWVGVIDPTQADAAPNPLEVMTAISIESFAGLLGGEYLQFALDLDGYALHYGIDGAWNSDPATADSGTAIARGASFAPAVMPHPSELHPYLPDKFEFNFGGSSFRYPMPPGYRAYDVVATTQAPLKPRHPKVARGAHERAFYAAVHEFEQPFDPITDAKLREAVEAWRLYRDATCRLNARFKKSKGVSVDTNCIRAFGGALLAALPTLQDWNRMSMDPPFDELPPIDLEQHPKLHYVELDRRDVPEDVARFADGRPIASVRVTDKSAPLILFLRADGATHWKITVEPGVNVQHVFLFGQEKQVATVDGQVASLRSYSPEQDNSQKLWRVLYKGENSPDALATALETLIGTRPSSMQRGCKDARCEITADQANTSTGNAK